MSYNMNICDCFWETGVNNNGIGANNNQYYISDTSKKLTIQYGTGKIGISTDTPISIIEDGIEDNIKLDVNGSINLSGNIYKNGNLLDLSVYQLSSTAFNGDYNNLTNKPTLFSGAYLDLTGKPDLSVYQLSSTAFSGDYNSLTGKPDLSVYQLGSTAFNGDYNSLTGKPDLSVYQLGSTAFNGDYNSLTNKPDLFSGSYIDLTGKPDLSVYQLSSTAFNGDYNSLTGKPDLLKTTDINTSTLEIDSNGKLNVIQQVSDLTSYNAPISCTTLSTSTITAISDQTYIATFRHTNLTLGIGIGYDKLVAMGSNDFQNITIASKSTGDVVLMTNGATKFYIDGTDGGMRMVNNNWHRSLSDGYQRLFFSYNGGTILRGYLTPCIEFRNSSNSNVCQMYNTGGMWILGALTQNSDSRIKTNIQDINDDEALNKILALEPKTYEYIDKKLMGEETVYGFIAQQVKEVLPKAVEIVSEYVPNILKNCDCEGNKIYVSIPQDVPINTDIKIIDKEDVECKIIEIGIDYIRIDKSLDVNSIFVYGYKVDDFHRMKKDYIYTINVCATQILSRKIDEQQQEINELKEKLANVLAHLGL